jgi:hypothetical protein
MDEQDGQDGTSPGERSGRPGIAFILCILFIHVKKILAAFGCGFVTLCNLWINVL